MSSVRTRVAIAWRIDTPRLSLRALVPSDAQALCSLIDTNLEFLRRWMARSWNEPVGVEVKRTWLRGIRREMRAGGTAAYGVRRRDSEELIGTIGTHPRIGAGAREIGYWLAASHLRHGYTSEAAAALTKFGFEAQRLRRMEIHTDPDNAASVGVARTIGFREHTLVRQCILSPKSPVRDNVIWAMTRAQYTGSKAESIVIEAIDRRGRAAP